MATATTNAWGVPTPSPSPSPSPDVDAEPTKKPSLQEIMDEEFARQLYEEECRAAIDPFLLEEKGGAPDAFARLRASTSSRELLSADSVDDPDANPEDLKLGSWANPTPNVGKSKPTPNANAPKSNRFERSFEGDARVTTGIRETFRKWEKDTRHGTGSGRVEAAKFATRDRVMDEKTTLLLQKLINRGDLDEMHGCLQTGKEANVYHAVGTDEQTLAQREYAVKIFKSTLSEFSNRSDYVLGDGRFDMAYTKKSAQRQLKEWTEKEFRNLCRAIKCQGKGLRVPTPVTFKEHVLVMSFVGKDGWSAPTLKEATLSAKQLIKAYADVLVAVRTLYQDAKLVHGDLSEYNILYHNRQCWLIDFGQAVDHHHPEYFAYLQRDLLNVRQFFERSGLVEATNEDAGVLSEDAAFEFVTNEDGAKAVEGLAAWPAMQELLGPAASSQRGGVLIRQGGGLFTDGTR